MNLSPDCFDTPAAARLASLIGAHHSDQLEAALVWRLIDREPRFAPSKNQNLIEILNRRDKKTTAARQALVDADVRVSTINDMVRAFEVLAADGRGGQGTVFTPEWVANLMATQAIDEDRKNGKVIDPSCGCGSLLVAALRRLHHLHKGSRSASEIIEQQLFGNDIHGDGVRRAKLLLTLAAIELGSEKKRLSFGNNFTEGDSLEPDRWTDQLNSFDVVIGNPPYVRYHQLSVEDRDKYRESWEVLSTGNFNLYYAFFELAHRLRADKGVVVYIAPNAYLRAASAKALRSWMVEDLYPTRIIDYGGARVFNGALTYTAITISDHRANPGVVMYADASSRTEMEKPPPASHYARYKLTDLGSDPWSLVGKAHQKSIHRIQTEGQSILDLAEVRFGLSTLRDNLYLLDGTQENGLYVKKLGGKVFHIEPGATQPAVKVSDVQTQEQLDNIKTRILFPYHRDNNGRAIVWTEEQLDTFPLTRLYLEAVKDELAKRDKGKKEYAAWYAYGRTQGLADWTGDRLLTPLYAARPRFLVDTHSGRLFTNGCAITPKDSAKISTDLLAAILNSGVLHFFIEQTSSPINGGYFSYQKEALRKFHVPDSVIEASAEIVAADVAHREELLAKLYGVSLPAKYTTG